MKDLETMQREEREALKKDFNNLYQKEYTTDFKEKRLIRNTEIDIMSLDNLDQHTANVWKAAQESMKKNILESGLLEEKINYFRCIRQEGMAEGHNQAVRAVKGFMSNMDTNSVDSIHLNKQAN